MVIQKSPQEKAQKNELLQASKDEYSELRST